MIAEFQLADGSRPRLYILDIDGMPDIEVAALSTSLGWASPLEQASFILFPACHVNVGLCFDLADPRYRHVLIPTEEIEIFNVCKYDMIDAAAGTTLVVSRIYVPNAAAARLLNLRGQ